MKSIKDIFFKSKGNPSPDVNINTRVDIAPVFYNDAITIVDKCCRCCTNSKPPTSTGKSIEYIEKRIKIHHESILEHSNIVIKIRQDALDASNFMAIIDSLSYITIVKDQTFLYFAASIRGWKEFFKHADMEHPTVAQIYTEFSVICPRCMVADLIDAGYCDEYDFPEMVSDPDYDGTSELDWGIDTLYSFTNGIPPMYDDGGQNISIVNIDSFGKNRLDHEWIDMSGDRPTTGTFESEINVFDFLKLGTVTVCFENMSRAATHQLVRHRNAITQESMRYVNYSDAGFFVPDKADQKTVSNGNATYSSWDDYYASCINAYNDAIGKGVPKEDARYLLPNAVECGQLYMTFRWYSLAKFLQLRMDKAAQTEIRNYAILLYETLKNVMNAILEPFGVTFKDIIDHIDDWSITNIEAFESYSCDEACDEPADTDDDLGTINM